MSTEQTTDVPADAQNPDNRFIWYPWSPIRSHRERVLIDRASGYRVWDPAGNEYIDASSMNSTCGYAHPHVVEAATRQLGRMHGVDISVQNHGLAALLAERLASYLPEGPSRTLFTNSGSEGIEASALIASSYWSHLGRPRTRIVTFERGYHGSTVLARSLSDLPPTAHGFTDPLQVTHVRFPVPAAQLREPEALQPLLAAFEEAIGNDSDDLPMAVLVEPLINVGGGVVLPRGFLSGLRRLCDSRDVLLIMDEVFTGIGRTGRVFGFQHEEISPDIVISSKGLSAGYVPITAVTVQEHVYQTFADDPVIGGLRYGHTTSGHAVGCAVGLAVLDVLDKENLTEHAVQQGRRLLDGLAPLAGSGAGQVRDVRGLGLLTVLELATPDAAAALVAAAERERLLVRQQGESILVVPPLTIDADGVDQVVGRLHDAVGRGEDR
ncbi:aspartate aminotransferase family protein [Streptomyces sp. NPDC058459]|uniref:aminotransferase family protein n=1 Tax=Streptomyces sp. NPDC058459 TaxID=3346508 RepID=UPI0036583CA9